jgi:drug/metabolite transporter (DMT)-like permease
MNLRGLGRSRGALAALVTGAVLIGFTPIFAKLAVNLGGISPIATAFWRVGLAAPMFVLWLWPRGELGGLWAARRSRRAMGMLALPGVVFVLDLICLHWSFELTPVANTIVLANFSAVLMTLFGWLVLGERPRALFALGGVVALFGVIWLTLGTATPAVSQIAPTSVGDGLALVTACFYAGYLLSIRHARHHFTVGQVMLAASALSAGPLLLVACATGGRVVPATASGWAMVLGLALVPQFVGQGLIALALPRLTASLSAVTLLIQPVMAALWGWVILGQALTAGQTLAGGVVLVGVFLARVASNPKRAVSAAGEATASGGAPATER